MLPLSDEATFVRDLVGGLKTLQAEATGDVSEMLKKNTSVTRLNLSYQRLGPNEAHVLGAAL